VDILIQTARIGPDPVALRRAVEAVTNWDAVLAEASRHGLGPLLYWRLKHCCPDVVPSAVSEDLREAFHANAARNLMMAAELLAVMGWLEAGAVAALAFKGPTLAAWVYGDIALREFCDLDILVRPADRARAISLLTDNGCRERGAAGAGELSGNCEIVLTTPNGCNVDLHWATSPPYFPPSENGSAWDRLHRVDVAGTLVPTFGADDLFACLALHGARHCWASLGLIGDVANLVRATSLDWDALLANRRTGRMFHVAALLACDLLSAPVPPEIVAKARRDAVAVRLARRVRRDLFNGDGYIEGRPSGALMHLRMTATLRDKARYVWRRALEANQTDNDFLPLHPRLRPLLHAIRPFRVLAKIVSRP